MKSLLKNTKRHSVILTTLLSKGYASVEFTGKIVNMEKGCIPVKLAEPLPFHKVLLIEYPYTYDDLSGVLRMHVYKTLWDSAEIGMSIDKMPGSDSLVVNNRSFAI